jgi:hypothetical protein
MVHRLVICSEESGGIPVMQKKCLPETEQFEHNNQVADYAQRYFRNINGG